MVVTVYDDLFSDNGVVLAIVVSDKLPEAGAYTVPLPGTAEFEPSFVQVVYAYPVAVPSEA